MSGENEANATEKWKMSSESSIVRLLGLMQINPPAKEKPSS
jgi:hypothetical protein